MRFSVLRPPSLVAAAAVLALSACQAAGAPRYLGSEAEYFTPSARIYFDTGSDEDDEIDLYQDGSLGAAVDFLGINWPVLIRESTLSAGKPVEVENAKNALKRQISKRMDAEGVVANRTDLADTARRAVKDMLTHEATEAERTQAIVTKAMSEAELEQAKNAAENAKKEEAELAEEVATTEAEVQRANKMRLDGDWILGPRLSVGISGPAGDSEDGTVEATGAPVLYLGLGLYLDLFKGDRKPNSNEGVGVRLEGGYIWGVTADEDIGDADDSALYVGMTVFL